MGTTRSPSEEGHLLRFGANLGPEMFFSEYAFVEDSNCAAELCCGATCTLLRLSLRRLLVFPRIAATRRSRPMGSATKLESPRRMGFRLRNDGPDTMGSA